MRGLNYFSQRIRSGKLPVVSDAKDRFCYYVLDRSSIITKRFLGSRVVVAGDRRDISILIRRYMIGLKFGQFSFTKRTGRQIHPDKDKIRSKRMAAGKKKKIFPAALIQKVKSKKIDLLRKSSRKNKMNRRS